MALLSPGVEINIINEGFYDSSTAGSIPLIVIATASNKIAPSGSGVAPMTTPSKAGRLYLATSQRDLVQAYGHPIFYSAGGTQLHGHELNEYGLHGAYSFLGMSNAAYILRADIDLAALHPSDQPPAGAPVHGTYWFDVASSLFGVHQSNGNRVAGRAWINQGVKIATDDDTLEGTVDGVVMFVPKTTFGANGDFAIVIQTTSNFMFEKIDGEWLKLGSTNWKAARPTVIRGRNNPEPMVASDSFIITANGTSVTVAATVGAGIGIVADITEALEGTDLEGVVTADVDNGAVVLTNLTGEDITLSVDTGTPLAALGLSIGTRKGTEVVFTDDVSYPEGSNVGDVWVKGTPSNRGADLSLKSYNAITGIWEKIALVFREFDSTVLDGTIGKDDNADDIASNGVVYVGFDPQNGVIQFRRHNGSFFHALSYEASINAPTSLPMAGSLWFSNDFRADIMVSDGSNFVGYRNMYPDTNPRGAFVQSTQPLAQSDGTPVVENDLWIDTSDLENYPRIRRYDSETQRWNLIDNTDQSSPFGVLFADARSDSGVEFDGQVATGYAHESELITDMLVSDFLDPDAPDGRSVPSGMLLFNTRYSTYNVKRWEPNYFGYDGYDADVDYSMTTYSTGGIAAQVANSTGRYVFPALTKVGRWVTISGNRADGSPLMGRRAQRAVITKSMAEAMINSEEARSDVVNFNLIAAPAFPELIDEMVTLNTDQRHTAFVIGDAPARLSPRGDAIQKWALNAYAAGSNGEDGLTSNDDYLGIYYPWGLGKNTDGAEVMIPPSTMALRVYAHNDQVSYPWFAPAGFTRGLVTNADSVGYIDDQGEYQTVILNRGLQDILYQSSINPITFMQGRGLVINGQKTRASLSSSMDRVNVARLYNYMATALDGIAKPFLFQQNDQQTRDAFKTALDKFLSGLIGLRAIEDYAVQCDTENNTRARIARNELWADIAVLPTQSVEFIYIPIRNIG